MNSNMMMSMNNLSVGEDDQLMTMIMCSSNQQHLFDSTENQPGDQVKIKPRRRRRRKPDNDDMGAGGKRKLTEHQAAQLELYFESEPKLETERKEKIAAELGLEPRQVAVWFQNRRARWKCKKLEDDYANLRTSHRCVLAQNALLEAQVSELSGRLVEAKCEIQRLSGRPYDQSGTPSYGNTPTPSSSSIMSMDRYAHKGFGAEDDVKLLESDYVRVMDDYYWMNNMYDLM